MIRSLFMRVMTNTMATNAFTAIWRRVSDELVIDQRMITESDLSQACAYARHLSNERQEKIVLELYREPVKYEFEPDKPSSRFVENPYPTTADSPSVCEILNRGD